MNIIQGETAGQSEIKLLEKLPTWVRYEEKFQPQVGGKK